jgi:hypothetical protein
MKASTCALLFLVCLAGTLTASTTLVYNNIPGGTIYNLPSVGYEATSTTEFGGLVKLEGGGATLAGATVAMSNWALESTYEAVGTSTGFLIPLTLNLYEVGAGNAVGGLITSVTINAFIQWRPEASAVCGTAWQAADGSCRNGLVTLVSFNLNATVPEEFIYGLSYNTQHYGNDPTGESGPYNSLNFGLNTSAPSVGSNPLPGSVYWNTSYAGFYADGGASGVGTFRQDTNWGSYSGAIAFYTGTPEPSAWMLLGTGLLGLAWRVRRRG